MMAEEKLYIEQEYNWNGLHNYLNHLKGLLQFLNFILAFYIWQGDIV